MRRFHHWAFMGSFSYCQVLILSPTRYEHTTKQAMRFGNRFVVTMEVVNKRGWLSSGHLCFHERGRKTVPNVDFGVLDELYPWKGMMSVQFCTFQLILKCTRFEPVRPQLRAE
jgi:hypothetical protein